MISFFRASACVPIVATTLAAAQPAAGRYTLPDPTGVAIRHSEANDATPNCLRVVGTGRLIDEPYDRPMIWTYNGQSYAAVMLPTLPDISGDYFVRRVSSDGSTVIGSVLITPSSGESFAIRWKELPSGQWSVNLLPELPSDARYVNSVGISDDGSTIAGFYFTDSPRSRYESFLWSESTGIVPLLDNTLYRGHMITDISDDGQTVVGTWWRWSVPGNPESGEYVEGFRIDRKSVV